MAAFAPFGCHSMRRTRHIDGRDAPGVPTCAAAIGSVVFTVLAISVNLRATAGRKDQWFALTRLSGQLFGLFLIYSVFFSGHARWCRSLRRNKAVCKDMAPILVGYSDPILFPRSQGNMSICRHGGGFKRARRVDDTHRDHVIALHLFDEVRLHEGLPSHHNLNVGQTVRLQRSREIFDKCDEPSRPQPGRSENAVLQTASKSVCGARTTVNLSKASVGSTRRRAGRRLGRPGRRKRSERIWLRLRARHCPWRLCRRRE